jgi:hypothetical protein
MVLTYDRKQLLPAGHVFQRVQITTGKNYDPKKNGTVIWPTVEIHVFWRVQITTGKTYDPKRKSYSRLADG